MTGLDDVVGAVISHISRGRSQADIAVLEVAKAYKDSPLLKDFPVPRMTLDEVIIDLKVSFSAAPPTILKPETKKQILTRFEQFVDAIPSTEFSIRAILKEFPVLQENYKSSKPDVVEKLSLLIPSSKEVDAESIAYGASVVLKDHISNLLFNPKSNINIEKARDFIIKESSGIEKRMVSQIQDFLLEIVKSQPIDKNKLDILITASELQSLSPEKITTLKLTLHESDRTWTQIEYEKGEIKDKLVPS